jgi:hypothetical protein
MHLIYSTRKEEHVLTSLYWVTKPDYRIAIARGFGTPQVGKGVDLTELELPILRDEIAFKNLDPAPDSHSRTIEPENSISTSTFLSATTDYEEASILNAYFRGSYGLSSFSAYLNKASEIRSSSRTEYVLVESTAEKDDFPHDAPQWKGKPSSEGIADPNERREQFLRQYGSHYITAQTYAFRIAIQGAIETIVQSEREEFGGAFKAWGLSGGLDTSHSSVLRKSNVSIRAEVTAGKILPKEYENSWILYSFDQITAWLEKLQKGVIQVTRAPTQARLTSFWTTLLPYPKSREVLKEMTGDLPTSPFGVPAGTILPWYPKSSDLRPDPRPDAGPNSTIIVAPNGWEICDGRNPNVPDLRGLFLIGAPGDVLGRRGGTLSHAHGGSASGGDPDAWSNANNFRAQGGHQVNATTGFSHSHPVVTDQQVHLPPHISVVYIMKL